MEEITAEILRAHNFEYEVIEGWHSHDYKLLIGRRADRSYIELDVDTLGQIGKPLYTMHDIKNRYKQITGKELKPYNSDIPPTSAL